MALINGISSDPKSNNIVDKITVLLKDSEQEIQKQETCIRDSEKKLENMNTTYHKFNFDLNTEIENEFSQKTLDSSFASLEKQINDLKVCFKNIILIYFGKLKVN